MRTLYRQVECDLYNWLVSVLDNKINLYREWNTEIERDNASIYIYLHGNKIWEINTVRNTLSLNDCWWHTKTTCSRFNILWNYFGFEVKIIKWDFYLIKDDWDKIKFNYSSRDNNQYLVLDID